jgi:hypothetical protein
MLFMQSCASNKGYFLPTAKTQSHNFPAKSQQDSLAIIPAEKLDSSENTVPILTDSINSYFVSDSKLKNYEVKGLELDKKFEKQIIAMKPITKSPKLNFLQKVVLKKMDRKAIKKDDMGQNMFLFWLSTSLILISIYKLRGEDASKGTKIISH